MDAKVTWHKRLSFTGTADTGFDVPLGANPKVGGDNDGFRPMELIATGLAGCTAMDVISILQKKRQDITSFEVIVRADQADQHPSVFTKASIEYIITGHSIKEAAITRAIELSATRYCPAQAMFDKIMPIELKYFIFEADQDSAPKLVTNGVYVPKTDPKDL